jgi:hypothetical protein
MADEQNVTADDDFFIGEDKTFPITVYTTTAHTLAQDVSGWALSWILKRKETDADVDALLTKTTAGGGIALTTPGSGLVTVTVLDTDTDSFQPGAYHHELKRTDAGFETVLTFGRVSLKRGIHRT